jgi:hypothetical protein
VSLGNMPGMMIAGGIKGNYGFGFLGDFAEQILPELQLEIATLFILLHFAFVEIVIAGLTALNAVVSEDAQHRPLQDRARESKFTLRFFQRKGEKVVAGGAPVS